MTNCKYKLISTNDVTFPKKISLKITFELAFMGEMHNGLESMSLTVQIRVYKTNIQRTFNQKGDQTKPAQQAAGYIYVKSPLLRPPSQYGCQ